MCDLAFTACLTCMTVDFFRRERREVSQDESGAWWAEGYRLGRCLDEVHDEEINTKNGEAA